MKTPNQEDGRQAYLDVLGYRIHNLSPDRVNQGLIFFMCRHGKYTPNPRHHRRYLPRAASIIGGDGRSVLLEHNRIRSRHHCRRWDNSRGGKKRQAGVNGTRRQCGGREKRRDERILRRCVVHEHKEKRSKESFDRFPLQKQTSAGEPRGAKEGDMRT